jgi:hypothetical protein
MRTTHTAHRLQLQVFCDTTNSDYFPKRHKPVYQTARKTGAWIRRDQNESRAQWLGAWIGFNWLSVGPVASCCETDDEPSSSGVTELVNGEVWCSL